MHRFVSIRTLSIALAAAIIAPNAAGAAVLVVGGGLGESCYKQAQRGEAGNSALDTCSQALDQEALSPRDRASTYVNRGVIRLRRADYEGAVSDFDRAIGFGQALGEAYVNRGAARLGQRRYAEAIADLDKGLSMGASEPAKAWYDKGLAHEGLGDEKSAYFDYQKAIELRPDWQLPKDELKRFTVKQG
jgi:tetratricopeptide (TPR) repeat protein